MFNPPVKVTKIPEKKQTIDPFEFDSGFTGGSGVSGAATTGFNLT